MGVTSGSMQRDLKTAFEKFNGSFEDFLNSNQFKDVCIDHNKTACVLWSLNVEEFAESCGEEIPEDFQVLFDKLFKENEEGWENDILITKDIDK